MFDAKDVVLPDGWQYVGIVTPCFPTIPHHEWLHKEGWRGHLPIHKVEKGDYSIAIIDDYEIVGFSTTLP